MNISFSCRAILGLSALALTLSMPTALQAQERFFPYESHSETLDNGLSVVLIPMESGGLLSYWTLVRTGARDEVEPGRTGFAHFFEHMMFRGTEKYPAEKFNEIITRIGASSNAYTTDDFTAYHLDIAAGDLETVMDLESDRFQNLSYSKAVFQTEAGAVYGEYRKNRASPFFTIYEGMRQAAFDEHTYGHTAMGYVQDIQGMPQLFDYSLGFFDRFYRPDNSILMIVGDLEVGPTMEMIKKYYGSWKSGYQSPEITPEPEQKAERRIEVSYEGSSLPIVWLAYKSPAFDPADKSLAAADLLCDLAFGETSTLYNKLVLEEQLVELLDSGTNMNRDPSVIDVYTRVKDPANVERVLQEIDQAIAAIVENPPSAEELEKVQKRRKYSFLMALDAASNVASMMARILAVSGELKTVDTYFTTMSEVAPEDIQEAARTYFDSQRRTVAVLKGAQ